MKPIYNVSAVRDERTGWWAIESDDVDRLFSQAKRIDQIDYMARDAIALLLEVAPDSFELEDHLELDPETQQLISETLSRKAAALTADRAAQAATREAVRRLASKGLPLRDVGSLLGVSYQRAHQLLNG